MIIKVLSGAATLVVRSLEGIVTFLVEALPLLFKILFGLSPFVLGVFATHRFFGSRISIFVGAGVVLLLILGWVWSVRQGASDTRFTPATVFLILVVDAALGASIPLAGRIIGAVDSSQPSAEATVPSVLTTSEQQFISSLDQAITRLDFDAILRACDALGEARSTSSVPVLMRAVGEAYKHASMDAIEATSACIRALGSIEDPRACPLLRDLQIRSRQMSAEAEQAADYCD